MDLCAAAPAESSPDPQGSAAARRSEWLEVRVRDRGAAFGRGSVDGLGLGLTIIARLAAELKIVQEGEGTEVRMRFPLAAD